MVELIVKLEPSMYQKYVTTRPKGEPILHVKLLNALYGLLRSVLLLKKGYEATLKIWVLKLTRMTCVYLTK